MRPGGSGDLTLPGEAASSAFVAWSTKRGGPYMPTPIVYGDNLYTVANNGVIAAYVARTGERLYQERVAGKGGAFSASPVAADGKLYFSSEDGEIFVVKAGPKPELLGTNPMGEVLMATPGDLRRDVVRARPQTPVRDRGPAAKAGPSSRSRRLIIAASCAHVEDDDPVAPVEVGARRERGGGQDERHSRHPRIGLGHRGELVDDDLGAVDPQVRGRDAEQAALRGNGLDDLHVGARVLQGDDELTGLDAHLIGEVADVDP